MDSMDVAAEQLAGKSQADILGELADTENDIMEMMRLAQQTAEEMQRLPACSPECLEQLSSAYLSKLKDIQEKLKSHSTLLEARPGEAQRDAVENKTENGGFVAGAQGAVEHALKALEEP